MKKHELLEKAMRDYPIGTNYVSPFSGSKFTSKGVFVMHMNGVAEVGGGEVFDGDKWANIVSAEKISLLSGKCAIQVNNEREFKLLMEHYEGKGWKSNILNENSKYNHSEHYCCYDYHDSYRRSNQDIQAKEGYKIILFADFAAEVGIKVPVFIMNSEDGVDLYEGDDYFLASKFMDWQLVTPDPIKVIHSVVSHPLCNKALSTKEAAEDWVTEQNKPKSVTVYLYFGGAVEVYSDHVSLHGGVKVSPSDLEDMLHAIQSLTKS